MEQQLDMVLSTLAKDTAVQYLVKGVEMNTLSPDRLYVKKYEIDACPDQTQILNALQKRIGRSDTLKSQKHALGICVLLLLSSGYCVSSSTLPGVEDSLIERCWECIQVVSQNVPLVLSRWIQSSMGKRSPSGYSVLFCVSRPFLSSVDLLKDSISGTGHFSSIDATDFDTPGVLWHRDDSIRQTMILHFRLQDRDLS